MDCECNSFAVVNKRRQSAMCHYIYSSSGSSLHGVSEQRADGVSDSTAEANFREPRLENEKGGLGKDVVRRVAPRCPRSPDPASPLKGEIASLVLRTVLNEHCTVHRRTPMRGGRAEGHYCTVLYCSPNLTYPETRNAPVTIS